MWAVLSRNTANTGWLSGNRSITLQGTSTSSSVEPTLSEVPQMNRKVTFLAAFLVGLAVAAVAQKVPSNLDSSQNPPVPRPLIAWSNLQKPHPVPQPLPPPDTPVPQPDQPNASPKPADPQTQQTPAKTFIGKISKSGDGYVLTVTSDAAYKLEGVDASPYDNKNVKITGELEQATKTIHVATIKLIS